MFKCSRQHASRSVQLVKKSASTTLKSEPLLFLYPKWFKLEPSQAIHTGPTFGRDERALPRRCHTSRELSKTKVLATSQLHRHRSTTTATQSSYHEQSPASTIDQPVRKIDTLKRRSILLSPDFRIREDDVLMTIQKLAKAGPRLKLPPHPHFSRKVDPEKVALLLRSIRPHSHHRWRNATELLLDSDKVEKLWGTASKNMWSHDDGSGRSRCIVHVIPGSDPQAPVKILLEGSNNACDNMKQCIRERTDLSRIPEEPDETLQLPTSFIYRQAGDIPKPSIWTIKNFFEYISSLIRPRTRRSIDRQVYPNSLTHTREVGQIFLQAFTDPASRPFISTAAFQLAIRFCLWRTNLNDVAAKLWDTILELGLQPDILCCNYELRRCLLVKDDAGFERISRYMRDSGIEPDGGTWNLALWYAESVSARLRVLQIMASAGALLDRMQNKHVIETIAHLEVSNYSATEAGLQSFTERMTKIFGPDWFSVKVLQRMLQACYSTSTHTGDATAASNILSLAQTYNVKPNMECIVELFCAAREAGDLKAALELFKLESSRQIREIRGDIIEIVFMLAWKEKCFNLCRLFWHLGAVSGRISWEMQKVVAKSVECTLHHAAGSEDRAWQLLAGKLIIGTDLNAERFTEVFPLLSKGRQYSSPVELLFYHTESADEKKDQLELGNLLIERDLNAWTKFHIVSLPHFFRLVKAARTLDQSWKISDAARANSPRDLLRTALKIRLRRRSKPVSIHGHDMLAQHDPRQFIVQGRELIYNNLRFDERTTGEAMEAENVVTQKEDGLMKWIYLESKAGTESPQALPEELSR